MGYLKEQAIEENEKEAKEYMEKWAEWMDAPLGISKADQAHLDSLREEK